MKTKSVLLLITVLLFCCVVYPQHSNVQQKLFATSEEEVYKLYDRMLDSVRLSNQCLYPRRMNFFGWTFFEELEGIDTIIKFKEYTKKEYEIYGSKSFYNAYLSCDMPIDFYERLLNYWKNLDTKENYCIRKELVDQIPIIKQMLIKRYESGKFNKQGRRF